jgi:predicted small lipoprotein YifL
MKKTIYTLAVTVMMTGTALAGCGPSAPKQEMAETNVTAAKEELQNAKQQQVNAEYPAFKRNAEIKIADNEKQIANLRAKLAQPGKSPMDDMRRQKIDNLEKQNADLRSELYGYEKGPSDWTAFKLKFNHDEDRLHNAFRDFGNDLKKKN